MANSAKDRIYVAKQDKIDDFVFDDKVASVFTDMIQRSVPGYAALNQLIPIVAKKFIQPGTNVYDLGCSLGEASLRIAEAILHDNVNIFAVDNSQSMINRFAERLAALNIDNSIKLMCNDVIDINFNNASFIILNYTLQFIDRVQRDALILRIYSDLNTNGALLLSEKIAYEDVDEEAFMQQMHEEYKRTNQYSDLEISQKREALDNVLIRDTHVQHINRLSAAGFSKVFVLAKYINFITYVAVK